MPESPNESSTDEQGWWNRFWFQPTSPTPVCLLRIYHGILVLINGLLYAPDFLVWFGAAGPSPPEVVDRWSPSLLLSCLLWLKPGDNFYKMLLCGYILAAILVTIGLLTRTSLVITWSFQVVIFHRNPAMWHQVDFLIQCVGFFMIFTPCGARYSVDSLLGRTSRAAAPWAQRLIQVQMCLIYFEAFFGKMAGQLWRNGTAVYYVTHFVDGQRFAVPAWLDHMWCYNFFTYYTLVIEFSLCFLVWWKPLRYWILLGGVALHLGIFLTLNLDLLSFGIMQTYFCFLDPADIDRCEQFIRRKLSSAEGP